MSKKVLVTGGAGYIGHHVISKLLDKGYEVVVLDNLMFSKGGLNGFHNNKRFQFLQGDVRHVEDIVSAVRGCFAVIHLAAIVGDSACELNPEVTCTVNYEATKVLLEICKSYGVKRFIFASTCSVYGASSDDLVLNEGSHLSPISLYARTRVQSEKVILTTYNNNITPVILRLATVYGMSGRMRFDLVINILTAKAVMDHVVKIYGGNQWRPIVHVQDAAAAFVLAMEAPDEYVDHEIFNVGTSEQNYRVAELGKIVQEYIGGSEVQFFPQNKDERSYNVSFDKIRHMLGFKAEFTVKQGIEGIRLALLDGTIKEYKDSCYYNINYQYKQ